MKRIYVLLAVLFLVTSCNNKYTYVEVIRQQQIFDGTKLTTKEEVKIRARTDTSAYLEAYQQFCISQAVYQGMKQRYEMPELLDIPVGFKLYNSKGVDISKIEFKSRIEQEHIIKEKALRIGSDVFNR